MCELFQKWTWLQLNVYFQLHKFYKETSWWFHCVEWLSGPLNAPLTDQLTTVKSGCECPSLAGLSPQSEVAVCFSVISILITTEMGCNPDPSPGALVRPSDYFLALLFVPLRYCTGTILSKDLGFCGSSSSDSMRNQVARAQRHYSHVTVETILDTRPKPKNCGTASQQPVGAHTVC